MTDWFEWNGTRCTAYGIHVTDQPEIMRASERATFTSVPGRSGSLTTLEGEDVYDDFILGVECIIENLNSLDAICGWLRGEGKVAFVNRQGGFYFARIVNQISFEQILRGNPHRSFTVNFRCQPFFYLAGVSDISVTSAGTVVWNPGKVFSEPVLQVTLTGNAAIVIGATYFELLGVTGTVTVDATLKETYMNYTSRNGNMSGDYPALLAGNNVVSWTGGVNRIVITPNWRSV
ncbi:MAG: hypothetical protein VB099_20545 [Candidatus Limiplasma sp.]|nr:hypothetical protein [Candidatus Limiplasma sp.]